MLAEINLLPEKNKRNITYPFIILVILLMVAAGSTFLFFYQSKLTDEISEMRQELDAVQLKSTEIEQLQVEADGTDYERLEQAVEQLQTQVVPVSLLLDYLVRLLPERGYILSFDYQTGTVEFDVSFDRMEEIAAYHHELEQSDVVSSITLSVVTANDMPEDIYDDGVLPRYHAHFSLVTKQENVKELGDQH
ncbi:hypothetical protein GN156_03175 [bacterium LRH843]|nr:hypothetical protein [bacterium LRH843]